MADSNPTFARSRPAGPPADEAAPVPDVVIGLRPEDYRDGFGEELVETLNVDKWRTGRDLAAEYSRMEAEVRAAVEREDDLHRRLRERIHPYLAWAPGAPKGAGVHKVTVDEIEEVHRGLLFNGGVECCDGNSHVHDTLALTIFQIGVSLVSYSGDQGTWYQRLFRRDLHLSHGDPVAETLDILQRRAWRSGLHQPAARDCLTELGERAIMSFAERAVLLRRSRGVWRMGHGSPAPLELLTGAGSPDLAIESIRVIRALIEEHQKFVFIPSEPGDRAMLSIGESLHPLEYAIVGDLRERLELALETVRFGPRATVDPTWDGVELSPNQWVRKFRDEVAPQVVVGAYRATMFAPARLFYAHVDHADVAARIALADSRLQEERGFPQLIDLADQLCRSVYGGGSLNDLASSAYAAAGVPFRYQSERATRAH